MKSLTKLSLTAGMIIIASQAIAREPLPVEVNGRNWSNAAERLPVYQSPAATVTTSVLVQPAVETVLGRASVVPVSSGEVVSNRVITAGSGRPAVEVVFGRGGAIPALVNDVVRAAQYQ